MLKTAEHHRISYRDGAETELEEKDATLQVENERRCAAQLADSLCHGTRNWH